MTEGEGRGARRPTPALPTRGGGKDGTPSELMTGKGRRVKWWVIGPTLRNEESSLF